MKQVTLGGDRLGSGKRQKIDLHGYERSTHNLSKLWRSTMSAGTLVPFLSEIALPGDTFDIDLEVDIKTHPTIGPLFGSYKVQLDLFQCPIRLYQGQLHNNKLGIGRKMSDIKLPIIELYALPMDTLGEVPADPDNMQINPSALNAYLGIRGIGWNDSTEPVERTFNGVPLLAYWDIYKNYYSNKQEEIGVVINSTPAAPTETVDQIQINGGNTIPQAPSTGLLGISGNDTVNVDYTGATPIPYQIIFNTSKGDIAYNDLVTDITDETTQLIGTFNFLKWGFLSIFNWRYIEATEIPQTPPALETFELSNIDLMRERILAAATSGTAPFNINTQNLMPYNASLNTTDPFNKLLYTQQGLGIKTYQSDLFNNWLSTEWIDGAGGINEITAIDTTSGSFSIDTLNLSKKVYDMLNRIAVSGGTYDDWLDTVYDHERIQRAESPIYHGGLMRELVFQEVVSNAESTGELTGTQPLGTLAGKGVMAHKKKGGKAIIRIDEPSYLIGIISLTPRIDYSQGTKWDMHLQTLDDLHKPALDQIGFQELITEQMAWWSTNWDTGTSEWITKSAGKQPAWINYMTNVNEVRGNFAIQGNEMFMTLNRRYEPNATKDIEDLTTYIDPVKFNHIFANTSIDAQNFWAQIAVDITARRKMSAKVMPNL